MKPTFQFTLLLISLASLSSGKLVVIDLDNQEDLRALERELYPKQVLNEQAHFGEREVGWSPSRLLASNPEAKHLFIVFENRENKNALALETQRHRLALTQAKNPKAAIIRSLVMQKVSVGHQLSVTSDKPAYLAVDLAKGTFREHKGKLGIKDLDKFVKQVENGTLNVVRKLRPPTRRLLVKEDRKLRPPTRRLLAKEFRKHRPPVRLLVKEDRKLRAPFKILPKKGDGKVGRKLRPSRRLRTKNGNAKVDRKLKP